MQYKNLSFVKRPITAYGYCYCRHLLNYWAGCYLIDFMVLSADHGTASSSKQKKQKHTDYMLYAIPSKTNNKCTQCTNFTYKSILWQFYSTTDQSIKCKTIEYNILTLIYNAAMWTLRRRTSKKTQLLRCLYYKES